MPKPFSLMPGPKGLPIFGSALNYSRFGEFRFDRLHKAKIKNYERYGKIYKERMGPATIVQLYDPKDIATVFRNEGKLPNRPVLPITLAAHKRDKVKLTIGSLNGEEWYKSRNSVQKFMMHPRAGEAYLPVQNKVADEFLDIITYTKDHHDQVSDLYRLISKYATESIGTVCFNTRLGVLRETLEAGSEAERFLSASADMFDATQKTTFAFPWYAFFRSSLYKQFVTGRNMCLSIGTKYVEDALSEIKKNPEQVDNETHEESPNFLSSLLRKQDVKVEDATGLCLDLFIAGIDSTANALSFILYNLGRNPEKQFILCEHIRKVVPMGAPVTANAINQLNYLKACVKESYRLNFPVEGGTTRRLETNLILSDYEVPKGTFVAMNNQTMCLLEQYFDQPQSYIPERWLKDGSATLQPPPPYVMMPFGYGPRMCLGRRFAEQEIYLALIKILQRFKLSYEGPEIGMLNRIFTMIDKPLTVQFTERLKDSKSSTAKDFPESVTELKPTV